MNDYIKYLENEKFVNWIAHPSRENNTYWESYIKENPDEKLKIQLLRKYLKALKASESKLTQIEKNEILEEIYKKMNTSGLKSRSIYTSMLKYAVVLILIVVTTLYFKISASRKESNIESLLQVSIDSVSDTKLILENNKEIAIDKERSVINYSVNDNLIINQKDTLNISRKKTSNTPQMNQLIVPFGRHGRLVLNDGSIVHVNSGSRLIFPKRFTGDLREVFLEGEAFFEVESDVNKPFRVRVIGDEGFSITAVGTKFNVHSKKDKVTTVLAEGEVHLTNQHSSTLFKKAEKTIIKPGELAEWSVSAKRIKNIKQVTVECYISWIDGILLFKGEALQDIAKRLKTYYNVEIDFSENIDKQFRLNGKLDLNDSIEKTMDNLAIAVTAKYKKTGNNKYLIIKTK